MSLFSDRNIKWMQEAYKVIEPFYEDRVQPASYELTLAEGVVEMVPNYWTADNLLANDPLDVTDKDLCFAAFHPRTVAYSGKIHIEPGGFCLVSTIEKVSLPDDVAARVEGKSSLGRLGLAIHTTAGWIDPGFQGNITLELSNLSKRTLELTVGMKIAQLAFFQTLSPAEKPYGHADLGSAYQNQSGVTGSMGTRG